MLEDNNKMKKSLSGANVLVADDEEIIRGFFQTALPRRGINVTVCKDGEEAFNCLENNPFDLVISDVRMPKMDGIELLRRILGIMPTIPVIMLTAYASIESAVEAMRIGAFDYLAKPITDLEQLDLTLARALNHRRILVENQWLKGELHERQQFDRLVGPGPQMQRIFEILSMVAPTNATVLVQGGSGTGKELVARAIHFNSPRANKPFIKVNCAAMPDGLIENEIFGHDKGAFTGAIKTTRGKFEAANSGTLLLDEIGDMPLGVQAKLLRVLQEKEFQRIGSNDTIKVDFRLIATTNIDLAAAVKENRFREDLFYRLNVIPVKLPQLSDRRDDIIVLAHHFLNQFSIIHNKKIDQISPEALKYLYNAPWKGNVRELENNIERAVVMCNGNKLELHDFFINDEPPPLPETAISSEPPSYQKPPEVELTKLAELEKRHILSTLKALDGHRAHTADILGISIRTLRNKLNEYRETGENV